MESNMSQPEMSPLLLSCGAFQPDMREGSTGVVTEPAICFKSVAIPFCARKMPILQEAVRYMHINPLRVGMVRTLEELDGYRYCGYASLTGNSQYDWQETESVLLLFADRVSFVRRNYRSFAEECLDQGKRPDLIGGGLLCIAGGWRAIEALRKARTYQRSDERMPGDGDFVKDVLSKAKERLQQQYALAAEGVGFDRLVFFVSKFTGVPAQTMTGAGKERQIVRTRSLLCFRGVKELGLSLTDLAGRSRASAPTVSVVVQRGQKSWIVKDWR
jgi:putative transposase